MIPKMLETASKHSVIPKLAIIASDVHYWTTIEKNVIAGLSILANLSDKDYCTKECVSISLNFVASVLTERQGHEPPVF